MLSSRCYRHRFIHLFAVVLYFFQVMPSLQDSCIPSISTVHNVSHCPTSKQEWDVAATNKNCQNSVKQNCSVPELFKYHCLLRSDESTLVEVCAPEWKLNAG
ncbi:uncharacterized protein LOC134267913 [Saccostrea cucullata]|uniref:uncharacterized protein LOC134267913 n=1 Tax=Saccostrea cuccullata TaxID=36930 RepID=UPI002ED0545A